MTDEVEGEHFKPHFVTGFCQCGCEDCHLPLTGGCVCPDCHCDDFYDERHYIAGDYRRL